MREPMGDIQTSVCSVCGAQKRQSNHWWTIHVTDDGGLLLDIFRRPSKKGEYKLCGFACVTKIVNEYMGERIEGK